MYHILGSEHGLTFITFAISFFFVPFWSKINIVYLCSEIKAINMKKKNYVKPQVNTFKVESTTLLAGSVENEQLQNYEGEEWSDN